MLHFVLPTVEVREVGDRSYVAVTVAWDDGGVRDGGEAGRLEVECATSFDEAVRGASVCLEAAWEAHADGREPRRFAPTEVQVSARKKKACGIPPPPFISLEEQQASKGCVVRPMQPLPPPRGVRVLATAAAARAPAQQPSCTVDTERKHASIY